MMHHFEGPDVDRWAVPPAGEQGDGWKLDSDEGQAAAVQLDFSGPSGFSLHIPGIFSDSVKSQKI